MANPNLKTDPDPNGSRLRLASELQDRLRKAEAVLRSLYEAKMEADHQAKVLKRADAMKAITGSSGIERAIAATTRMIERLKREVGEVRQAMSSIEPVRLDMGSASLLG
ncbi:MAG: hypothetical protein ACIAQF_07695 [Phycisphaerales bacterium JB065]